MGAPDSELADFAAAAGLGGAATWTPLSGGVSCEAWKVEFGGEAVCVKRARGRLAVKADWRAPAGRVLFEHRWFAAARRAVPGSAPAPLGLDSDRGLIAMEFLPETTHRLWKADLLAGRVDVGAAARVGATLAAIHAATAGRAELAEQFENAPIFRALRLDPYLLATAQRRPAVAPALRALVERTARTRIALVHGDVSPKNILLGPMGPVFLDAETATWGDPAFDLAFCLNHLLLKSLAVPAATQRLAESFSALQEAYLERVGWEPPGALEQRAASLLPGLLLARIDGKSPVEYLTRPGQHALVRSLAEPLLLDPPTTLGEIRAAWQAALAAAMAKGRL